MGCNCGTKTTTKEVWVHTAPDGTKTSYGAEVLAKAAKARSGGTYVRQQ